MTRRSILAATERDSLLTLPDIPRCHMRLWAQLASTLMTARAAGREQIAAKRLAAPSCHTVPAKNPYVR